MFGVATVEIAEVSCLPCVTRYVDDAELNLGEAATASAEGTKAAIVPDENPAVMITGIFRLGSASAIFTARSTRDVNDFA